MIVGTAGHIDHGKTTLVKTLTGVDTDRLKEEKLRGISIELGYAYLPLPNGEVLGFVDVPGHERFVHHMLAGVMGIDFVALVIAADDGPMPTTREHLQILDLLGISQGVVVLSKSDSVPPARLDAVRAEIAALLKGTAFESVPIMQVSALTGQGMDELKSFLVSTAQNWPKREAGGGFRLAVDRCFTLAGIGTVVTGTALSGTAAVGDKLTISPSGLPVRVRSMHVQNRSAQSCSAGERCALNITAPTLDKDDVNRGDWVVGGTAHCPTTRFDARLRVLGGEAKALRHLENVHVHLGTAHVLGRVRLLEGPAIEPGREALAQVTLAGTIAAVAGDRFVIRDASATRTRGGGIVLDPLPPQRGARRPERLAWLTARADKGPGAALALALQHAAAGVDLARFAATNNLLTQELEALLAGLSLVRVRHGAEDRAYSRERWQQAREAVLRVLAAEQRRAAGELGATREKLHRAAVPAFGVEAFGMLVDELRAEGKIALTGARVHLPGQSMALEKHEQAQWERVRPLFEQTPFSPPRVDQLALELKLKEPQVRALFSKLAKIGEVYAVSEKRFFLRSAIKELADIVKSEAQAAEEGVSAARLRDRIGIGRNIVIELLDFFNRVGFTRRVKDAHKLRDPKFFDARG